MNNLETTMGTIRKSIPSNPHAVALTSYMEAVKATIFDPRLPFLNTLLVLSGGKRNLVCLLLHDSVSILLTFSFG
jgi:hypothetical protein